MTTRRIVLTGLLALALPAGLAAQEGEQRRARGTASTAEQRAEMRERVETRFLDVAAERLELDATQKSRLAAVLRQNAEARRSVAEDGMRLRREAAELLRAESPDRARAESILNELTGLRERELQLWRAEQQSLADVLSATQRLELMALQARMHERVREMRSGAMGASGAPRRGAPRGERGTPPDVRQERP
ncbi:MAG TPA: hypothetical protein VMN78_11950 [Longimicrobiales bacterium]|nr:hypothetical protein [Longimicrobiales bacterium]